MKIKCALIATVVLFTVLFMTDISIRESDAEIAPESIMGIWSFEGKGDVVQDSTSNGNDGKIVGAKRVAGKEGQGIEFDGTNHVVIPATETVDDFLDGVYISALGKTVRSPFRSTRPPHRTGLAQSKYSHRSGTRFLRQFHIQWRNRQ